MRQRKGNGVSGNVRPFDADAIALGHRQYVHETHELRRRGKRDEAARRVRRFESIQGTRIRNAIVRSRPDQTRALLVILATQLRDGEALQSEVREYLANALLTIAMDTSKAAQALGLVPPRGNPSRADIRELELATAVLELSGTRAIYSGRKGPSAIESVAATHHVSLRTVRRAWAQWGAALRERAQERAG